MAASVDEFRSNELAEDVKSLWSNYKTSGTSQPLLNECDSTLEKIDAARESALDSDRKSLDTQKSIVSSLRDTLCDELVVIDAINEEITKPFQELLAKVEIFREEMITNEDGPTTEDAVLAVTGQLEALTWESIISDIEPITQGDQTIKFANSSATKQAYSDAYSSVQTALASLNTSPDRIAYEIKCHLHVMEICVFYGYEAACEMAEHFRVDDFGMSLNEEMSPQKDRDAVKAKLMERLEWIQAERLPILAYFAESYPKSTAVTFKNQIEQQISLLQNCRYSLGCENIALCDSCIFAIKVLEHDIGVVNSHEILKKLELIHKNFLKFYTYTGKIPQDYLTESERKMSTLSFKLYCSSTEKHRIDYDRVLNEYDRVKVLTKIKIVEDQIGRSHSYTLYSSLRQIRGSIRNHHFNTPWAKEYRPPQGGIESNNFKNTRHVIWNRVLKEINRVQRLVEAELENQSPKIITDEAKNAAHYDYGGM